MPSRLERYQQGGDTHFLTFSCRGRLPYLATPAARELFERALENMRRRYVFHVFGYVIMPEHVHLLVSEPRRGVLDRAIQALKTSVSKQSDQRPFWLARYYDFNVRNYEHFMEKRRHIYRNPVKAGLLRESEGLAVGAVFVTTPPAVSDGDRVRKQISLRRPRRGVLIPHFAYLLLRIRLLAARLHAVQNCL